MRNHLREASYQLSTIFFPLFIFPPPHGNMTVNRRIKTWWKEGVVYQIYPSSFCGSNGDGIGDLPGIISKLDYIASIGVDATWVCPMYDSPPVDMGYDISNYNEIYPPYGTHAYPGNARAGDEDHARPGHQPHL